MCEGDAEHGVSQLQHQRDLGQPQRVPERQARLRRRRVPVSAWRQSLQRLAAPGLQCQPPMGRHGRKLLGLQRRPLPRRRLHHRAERQLRVGRRGMCERRVLGLVRQRRRLHRWAANGLRGAGLRLRGWPVRGRLLRRQRMHCQADQRLQRVRMQLRARDVRRGRVPMTAGASPSAATKHHRELSGTRR